MNLARIIGNDIYDESGEYVRTDYIWDGKSNLAEISDHTLDNPIMMRGVHKVEPQRGACLEMGMMRVYFIARHEAVWMNWLVTRHKYLVWWYVFVDNVDRSFKLIKSFIIKMCSIWGLAHKEEGLYYEWRNIHAIDWLWRKITRGAA